MGQCPDREIGPLDRFETADHAGIDVFQIDPAIERQQVARVRAVRASRDREAWQRAVEGVTAAARDGSNLMPAIIDAVEARATVGEISDALRTVFGLHQEASTI